MSRCEKPEPQQERRAEWPAAFLFAGQNLTAYFLWWRLLSEECEEDAEEGSNLPHPEDEHPADKIGLRLRDLDVQLTELAL